MGFEAKILADSISPDGVRLTTFEVTFPRIVLSEFNTHRMLSRNSASSRAIPVKKMIERVLEDPYIPTIWGKNQRGMQAGEELPPDIVEDTQKVWLWARDEAVSAAKNLSIVGVHKQLTNRLLEPFMWHTVIVTATEWDNFFHLRDNPMAHPDIQTPAHMMRMRYETSRPVQLKYGEWHRPLIDSGEVVAVDAPRSCACDGAVDDGCWSCSPESHTPPSVKVSVGRCARVSYLTHDGTRDPQADIELHDRLLESGHMSPFEHVARPMRPGVDFGMADCASTLSEENFSGNFRGWVQYRKTLPWEHDPLNPEARR